MHRKLAKTRQNPETVLNKLENKIVLQVSK